MESQRTGTQVRLAGDREGNLGSETLVRRFLIANTHDPSEEVLFNTPKRYTHAFRELMGDHDEPWSFTVFESDRDEMVIVKDMSFVSLCEHHLLPFVGRAHVGYIPQGRLVGLSKIARAVKAQCRGIHVQEQLTASIAEFFQLNLDPLGVAVVMEAEHTCMAIRGVKTNGSKTITSSMLGAFRDNQIARAEFLALIR